MKSVHTEDEKPIGDSIRSASFWCHVDELRQVLWRAVVLYFGVVAIAFVFASWIFRNVIMAPCRVDFGISKFLYLAEGLLQRIGPSLMEGVGTDGAIQLMNFSATAPLLLQVSISFWASFILTFPFLLFLAWKFVSSGLLPGERRVVGNSLIFGTVLFYSGILVNYYVLFPVTIHFLAGYQLSPDVPNIISMESYMDIFFNMSLIMGLAFELPLVAWTLGRLGLLNRDFFVRYRRYAIVVLLIVAAIITPTGDPFTLGVVFVPLYALWEAGGLLVR